MESSIAVFLSRQPACERLPTSNVGWGGFWFGPRRPRARACARAARAERARRGTRGPPSYVDVPPWPNGNAASLRRRWFFVTT